MITSHKALRPIAIFEALKGAIVLLAGFGALSFLGRDNEHFAEQLVNRLHLNPANRYPHVFIQAMGDMTNSRLWMFAGFAALYASIRFAEAYGLWNEKRWAEWLAALSGAVYVPVEIYEIAHRASWLKFGALIINLIIVAYMVWLLTENRRRSHAPEKAGADAATANRDRSS